MAATERKTTGASKLLESSWRPASARRDGPCDVLRLPDTGIRVKLPLPDAFAESATCPIADWDAEGMTLHTPIRGLPAGIDAGWFKRRTRMSPTAARRVRDAVARRRRVDPSFLPWWPAEARLETDNAYWFLARAALDPRDSVALSKLMESECNVDPFESLHRDLLAEIENPATSAIPASSVGHGIFASVYARGADGFSHMLERYFEGATANEEFDAEWLDWCISRHPESCEAVEARLRRKEARAAADRAATAVPPPSDSTPAAEESDRDESNVLSEQLLAVSEAERAAIEAERDVLYDDLNDLNMRYAALQRELAAVRAGHDPRKFGLVPPAEELPTTLPDLLDWIETKLPPTVHVTPRAWRGIKKAVSVDFERVAKGLRFLRDVYVPYRTDKGVTGEQYAAAQVEAGFDECACFASASSLDAFPEYTIAWNGGTIQLDRHLKRGYSNNPRDMIRIYFAWCKVTKTVVVGSMPAHLDNWKCS